MDSDEQTHMERQHIFIVNDAPDVLDVLRELFQGEDYHVTTTTFIPNTVEQIAALDPDLLIVDLIVGHQAGMDLLERLSDKAATREMAIILMSTSRDLLNEAEDVAPAGTEYRYMVKPFDIDDLLQTVDELIGPA